LLATLVIAKETTMTTELVRSPPRPIGPATTTPIRTIMTRDPVTVRPDTGLERVLELFVTRDLGHVPVVDDAGRAIGVVSKTDLVRHQYLQRGAELHQHEAARDVMTPVALWLPETASLAEAAKLFAEGRLHAIPVGAADGRVVGVLSVLDLAAWVAGVRGP
jgi:CBS domain-containing protein